MQLDLVVVAAPAFNEDVSFPQGIEDLSIEQFILCPAIETLVVSIVPGAARFDEERLYP